MASATRRELGRGGSLVSYFRATGAWGLGPGAWGFSGTIISQLGPLSKEVSNRSITQPQFPCPSLKNPAEQGKKRQELRCP